jgi:O-antigen/teichoic acid export membrane protein
LAATVVNLTGALGRALVMFRALGPSGVGQYTWAVLVVGYFDILINFGLGILITRDVAREPGAAGRYLGSALLTRTMFLVASMLLALGIAGPLAPAFGVSPELGLTLVVLTLGVGISNLAGLVSALFNAQERMEYPALVTVFTTAAKVGLGATALQLGYGILGLAVVSIVVNLATAILLVWLLLRSAALPTLHPSLRFSVGLIGLSWALMLNNLLATVFFRIDGLILRGMVGDEALGWYSAAYRFIDGLNLIPSSLTLALFPILARIAASANTGQPGQRGPDNQARAGATFVRATERALKVLLTIGMPIAVGTTLLADPIVRLIAGPEFLPHAAIALQTLIWFVPFSFANGLLQYVLISTNQQRIVTIAFAVAVTFNVVANLIAVPTWSYVGAAVVTVLSEAVLLGPFWWATQHFVGPVRLLAIAWRPALAALLMAPIVWLARDVAALAIAVGVTAYPLALLLVGGVDAEDRRLLRAALGR